MSFSQCPPRKTSLNDSVNRTVQTVRVDAERWVARLTPPPGGLDDLLNAPLSLDVWERGAQYLIVAASAADLAELERRRLADAERIDTLVAYVRRHAKEPPGAT
ncbi:MAG: hypothetical protein ACR2RB_01160 [Gammaproteobacteria bacterium]